MMNKAVFLDRDGVINHDPDDYTYLLEETTILPGILNFSKQVKAKGYLINKQTVLIDEAKASGSWNEKNLFVNTLKTLITEGKAGVRQLYKDYAEQDTITNYWINTNYRDAFPLPYNEVRYFVYFS